MLFWTNLRQQLKKALISKSFLIILFAMIGLLLGIIRFSEAKDTPISIDIGVVLEGNSPHLQSIANSLMALDMAEIFIEELRGYTREELKELVAGERYEAVYIISDQLIDGVIRGKPRGMMEAYISPNFFMDKTMNAWIYSAVLIELSLEVSAQATSEILLLDKEDIFEEIAETYQYYEKNHSFVGLKSSYYGGGAVEEKGSELIYIRGVHGAIALAILLVNWALVPNSIFLHTKTMERLRKNKRRQIALSQFGVHLIVSLITGLVLITLLKSLSPALAAPLAVEWAALLLYSVAVAALGNIMAIISPNDNLVFSSSLFSFLVFLFLGGTIVDPFELGKVLGSFSKILPSYYYGDSIVNASLLPLIPLGVGGGVILAIMLLLGQKERKQNDGCCFNGRALSACGGEFKG